jgi:hypothetical protein
MADHPTAVKLNSQRPLRPMRRLTFVLFFVSGAVALVYEVVWMPLLVLILGSTHVAVTSVLTAFMAGLALGALAFGRYADRSGWHPLVLFGALETGVGIFAFAVRFLLDASGPLGLFLADRVDSPTAVISLIGFVVPLITMLPPTMLMGGTLPMLGRFLTRQADTIGWIWSHSLAWRERHDHDCRLGEFRARRHLVSCRASSGARPELRLARFRRQGRCESGPPASAQTRWHQEEGTRSCSDIRADTHGALGHRGVGLFGDGL